MKMLNRICFFVGIVIFCWLISNFIQDSFAYSYEVESGILFFDNDTEVLQKNIKKYLRNVDDLLIVNSSFEMSDVLVENYNFLTYFAFDYILNNYEFYSDKIIELDSYSYVDRYYNEKSTNKYISIEEIYEITDKYFGIRDYAFTDDNINVIGNNISLLEYANDDFSLIIDNVKVEVMNDLILAYVYYEGNYCYLYTFINKNEVLKIKNIEVIS